MEERRISRREREIMMCCVGLLQALVATYNDINGQTIDAFRGSHMVHMYIQMLHVLYECGYHILQQQVFVFGACVHAGELC